MSDGVRLNVCASVADVKTALTYGEDSSHFEIIKQITVISCLDNEDEVEI